MKQLEQLPEMADQMLGGLKADAAMKQRILQAAAGERPVTRRVPVMRIAAVACVCVIATGVGVFAINRKQPVRESVPTVYAMTAGESTAALEEAAPMERALLDLGNSSIQVHSKSASAFRSIWESSGNSFPMIGVNGQYYRMLTTPENVASQLLGQSLGTVQEYTTEPALASQRIVMSNAAASGAEVREIKGMGGAMVAAVVEGRTRVFQRVSFNGTALQGKEKLADTLQVSGHVTRIEISGVGAVEDSKTCEKLVSILLKNAVFESNGSLNNKQNLVLTLNNGLQLQLLVKDDRVAACGVWSCPEFFEAFEQALS